MKFYIESLGCARNQVDSETMLARLLDAGWRQTDDPGQAQAIVVNTCSFIEAAADESIDTILTLARYKRSGRCRRLIVAGCLPERYGDETARVLPEVDVFLGTGAFDQIVQAVVGRLGRGVCLLPDPDAADVQNSPARRPFAPHAAYVKITEGCSRRCTYCIIPKLRGRQKSRGKELLLSEARALIRGGARELTLVGQETTAYGHDLKGGHDLASLLDAVAALDETVWIRFLYGHPTSFAPAVLEAVARHPNVCPYFDIPVQHASSSVLRRMGRDYDEQSLLRLFDGIRNALPDAAVRTTVLVGFPGETESDFSCLLDFIEKVQFDHLGVFAYSDADDLPSHRLKDHVKPETARQRLEAVMQRQQHISADNLTRFWDRQLDILLDAGPQDGYWIGRSQYQAPEVDGNTLIPAGAQTDDFKTGRMIRARIVETLDYDLIARPIAGE